MMKFTKLFVLLFVMLLFGLNANAQNGWTGTYKFDESGGKTAGGSVIFIEHTLDITEKDGKLDAHFFSNGFQTSRDVYADGKIDGDKLLLYYRDEGEENFTSDYKKGELLLTLERKIIDGKTKILTYWAAFGPAIEKNEKDGKVYFEKTEKQSKSAVTSEVSKVEWIRVQSDNGEFSIEIPKQYNFFYDKEGFSVNYKQNDYSLKEMNLINSYIKDTLLSVEVYKAKDKALKRFIELDKKNGKVSETYLGKTEIKQIVTQTDAYYSIRKYFSSDQYIYVLTAATHLSSETPEMKRFLDSLVFSPAKPLDESAYVKFSGLNVTKINFKNTTENNTSKKEKSDADDTDNENAKKDSERLIVIGRPFPSYTMSARQNGVRGTITFKAVFRADGFISEAEVLTSLPDGLLRQAVFTLIGMKFIPARRNGVPYNIAKKLQFNFSIY